MRPFEKTEMATRFDRPPCDSLNIQTEKSRELHGSRGNLPWLDLAQQEVANFSAGGCQPSVLKNAAIVEPRQKFRRGVQLKKLAGQGGVVEAGARSERAGAGNHW